MVIWVQKKSSVPEVLKEQERAARSLEHRGRKDLGIS